METRLFSPRFMPGTPKLFVDAVHQRGYLFVNRWMPPTTTPWTSLWSTPFNTDAGFGILAGFSLSPGARDVSVCNRTAPLDPTDPFKGLDITADAAGLTYTKLAPTAAADPVVLTENRFDYEDSNGSNSGNTQCTLFATNSLSGTNNAVTCRTDLLPYKPVLLDSARQLLFVTQTTTGEVLVFDGTDLTKAPTHIAVGTTPVSIASDGTSRAYVVNRGSDSLSVIDLDARTVVGTVKVGHVPVSAFVDAGRAAGPLVYVLDMMSDDIAVYDPGSGSVRYAPTCMRPAEMVIDPSARNAVVHCKGAVGYPGSNGSTHTVPSQSRGFKLLD